MNDVDKWSSSTICDVDIVSVDPDWPSAPVATGRINP
jgi:hypothetical protein